MGDYHRRHQGRHIRVHAHLMSSTLEKSTPAAGNAAPRSLVLARHWGPPSVAERPNQMLHAAGVQPRPRSTVTTPACIGGCVAQAQASFTASATRATD